MRELVIQVIITFPKHWRYLTWFLQTWACFGSNAEHLIVSQIWMDDNRWLLWDTLVEMLHQLFVVLSNFNSAKVGVLNGISCVTCWWHHVSAISWNIHGPWLLEPVSKARLRNSVPFLFITTVLVVLHHIQLSLLRMCMLLLHVPLSSFWLFRLLSFSWLLCLTL